VDASDNQRIQSALACLFVTLKSSHYTEMFPESFEAKRISAFSPSTHG
jgi:hypothetical protein